MMPSDARALFDEVPGDLRLLRRHDFLALAEAGAFEDEDVELLFGIVGVREQPSPEHEYACRVLARRLTRQLGDRADVCMNLSFAASEYSLPRPDVFVLEILRLVAFPDVSVAVADIVPPAEG